MFFEHLHEIIEITGLQIGVKKVKKEVIIFPKGAKNLDHKLVSDVLDLLEEYPKIYEKHKLALTNVGIKGKERLALDNLRFSFEQLLKEKLKNNKSLENQKVELGKHLKLDNHSPEIRNLFYKVLEFYSSYQNENVKHNDNIRGNEVEFILYQTGILIRYIIRD